MCILGTSRYEFVRTCTVRRYTGYSRLPSQYIKETMIKSRIFTIISFLFGSIVVIVVYISCKNSGGTILILFAS